MSLLWTGSSGVIYVCLVCKFKMNSALGNKRFQSINLIPYCHQSMDKLSIQHHFQVLPFNGNNVY